MMNGMNRSRLKKYGRMLAAILAGNAIYFTIYSYLPRYLQHNLFQLDGGLLFDFLICLLIWIVISTRWNQRTESLDH
jgi:hypothetical protein